jgi:hypothetical protein
LAGWPSISGAVRLDVDSDNYNYNDNSVIPKIPVFSISSDDAKVLLGQLGGTYTGVRHRDFVLCFWLT